MSEMLGNFSLGVAVMVAAIATMAALASAWFEAPGALKLSRWMVIGLFGLFTAASGCLLAALLGDRFAIEYVAHYSEKALPAGYKVAAFWAGQEGSLLLWAWLLAGMAVVLVMQLWKREGKEPAYTIATVAGVCTFFAALMLIAANPFKTTPADELIPTDGRGMNPMLQDPGMIAHPPMLFLGYAGFTIPFAMMVGALFAGRKDNEWITATRRWTLASWLFLSIGIILGAQWAYVELGWGGYWAWDPVENASLLPWLTATALVHSIMVQQHRGMLKGWNAVLFALTFVLCIFGTYITRSGVIQSVHAFGKSLVGTFFLVFMVGAVLFSAWAIFTKRQLLKGERPLEGLLGREGMFLATNVVLVGMMAITTIGTVFPLISSVLTGQQITVKQEFYNRVVSPMGLLVVAMMSVGPLLVYGHEAASKLARGLVVPAVLGATVAGGLVITGVTNVWAVFAAFVCAVAVFSMAADLVRSTAARMKVNDENAAAALVRLVDANHRRYGGQTVHLGVVLMVIGIVGSSLFSTKGELKLGPGTSATFAGRTVSMPAALNEVKRENYTAVVATVHVTGRDGKTYALRPQRRFFEKAENPTSEVAIQSTWKEDLYLTLAGWEDGGRQVAIQAIVNPLVSWIWIGGIVMSAGAVLCMVPRVIPAKAGEEAAAPVRVAAKGRRVATV